MGGVSFFSRRRRSRSVSADVVGRCLECIPATPGGKAPNGATVFKANIGHATMKMHASLIAIVVADSPEEAAGLLRKWAKGDGAMTQFIQSGEFILEEITGTLKGVF